MTRVDLLGLGRLDLGGLLGGARSFFHLMQLLKDKLFQILQLRLCLVDASLLNPQTVMPPYFRSEGLRDVAPAFRDRPALTAQEIEDVVTYLASLRTP